MFYEESSHDTRGDEELLAWWCALPGAERLSVRSELVGGRTPRLRRALLSQPKRTGLLPIMVELLRAPTGPARRRL